MKFTKFHAGNLKVKEIRVALYSFSWKKTPMVFNVYWYMYTDCICIPSICWWGFITNSCIHMASLGRIFFTRKASKWPGLNTFTHGCRMTLAEASEGCQFMRAFAILWRIGAYRGSSLSFIKGSHGCNHAWMGMVSVNGFQFSTSWSNLGKTSWSKIFSVIHEGSTGSHVSRTSIRGLQALTFHLLQRYEQRYILHHEKPIPHVIVMKTRCKNNVLDKDILKQ